MSYDPLRVVAEVLGQPAHQMRDPATVGYLCPFKNSTCSKHSKALDAPAPVCSVYRKIRHGAESRPPICTCPSRFFEADLAGDIVRECWVGEKPNFFGLAHEVQMEKFGKVDLVVAEIDFEGKNLGRFVPVEIQAVDITGSVLDSYIAINNTTRTERPASYGLNWANVRKRFIAQLIAKGYYCHHWGTRIVAIVQEDLFDEFQGHAKASECRLEGSNIVFMLYQYERSGDQEPWKMRFKKVVPTTHTSVMNAILYEKPPAKSLFESKILSRLQGPVQGSGQFP